MYFVLSIDVLCFVLMYLILRVNLLYILNIDVLYFLLMNLTPCFIMSIDAQNVILCTVT